MDAGKFQETKCLIKFTKLLNLVTDASMRLAIMETRNNAEKELPKQLLIRLLPEKSCGLHQNFGIPITKKSTLFKLARGLWLTLESNILIFISFIFQFLLNSFHSRQDILQNGLINQEAKMPAWLKNQFQSEKPGKPWKNSSLKDSSRTLVFATSVHPSLEIFFHMLKSSHPFSKLNYIHSTPKRSS